MAVEMGADLALGFGDESKAPLVAESAAGSTDREATGGRHEWARSRAPLRAPRQRPQAGTNAGPARARVR